MCVECKNIFIFAKRKQIKKYVNIIEIDDTVKIESK